MQMFLGVDGLINCKKRRTCPAQEPVDPLKKEYKCAVDDLEGVLGNEGTQKVRFA